MGIGTLDEVEFQPRLFETEGPAQEGTMTSILSAIGRTPLIPLQRLASGLSARILAKVESLNPGGSIKDRVGVAMVEEAERRGWLQPGGTIIEATAGNTGVGLALAAAVKGYRCIFVLPDKMSGEKIRLLKAYGAEIVITPTSVPPDSPESYNGVADRLAREIPGAWRPNQFANLANPEVHYRTTGPEIWEQTGGRDHGLRRGRGHRRHDLRRGPLPQGAESRRSGSSAPTRRARSSRAIRPGPGRSRGSAKISCPRRSTGRWSTSGFASATPRASARPATWPGARVCSWAARPARPWPRRCGMPGGSRPTTWSSSSAPTPAATT